MDVAALIADIVDSKRIPDRRTFQAGLKKTLESLTRRSRTLISPYTITLGDEFQAVYGTGEELIGDIFSILAEVHPVRIRFAVGIGELTTELDREKALGMDGPAFHAARAGMNEMKKLKYSLVQAFGEDPARYELENAGLRLSMSIMSGWKRNTFVVFNGLRDGTAVGELAPLLGIRQRSVYKLITTNRLREFTAYFSVLARRIGPERG
jgi:hypothetical protein